MYTDRTLLGISNVMQGNFRIDMHTNIEGKTLVR
jgi:hypothetical protein